MLALAWELGDSRMIVAGGIWDQPAGEWAAQKNARYIAYLIETEARGADAMAAALDSADIKFIKEVILPMRQKLAIALNA